MLFPEIHKKLLPPAGRPNVSVPLRGMLFPEKYSKQLAKLKNKVSVPLRGMLFPEQAKEPLYLRIDKNVSVPLRGMLFPEKDLDLIK